MLFEQSWESNVDGLIKHIYNIRIFSLMYIAQYIEIQITDHENRSDT
jgi:hypothetical protein